jgi:hypothetical protein
MSDVDPVLESERLQECLEAAQAVEKEAKTVRAQLADADGRVASKSLFGDRWPPSFSLGSSSP